jgi:hypothetical protein
MRHCLLDGFEPFDLPCNCVQDESRPQQVSRLVTLNPPFRPPKVDDYCAAAKGSDRGS